MNKIVAASTPEVNDRHEYVTAGVTTKDDIKQRNLTELKLDNPRQHPTPELLDVFIPWNYLCLVAGGTVLFTTQLKALQLKQNTAIAFTSPKTLTKISCSNCQFFASNPYLKCAVHPYIALTEKAQSCLAHLPQNGKVN